MTLTARWTLLWLLLVALVVGQHLTAQAPPAPAERNNISLREYMESRVQCEKDLVAEQRYSASLALKLQTAEYERRAESVERDALRLKESQINYAPRESFEDFVKKTGEDLGDIKLRMARAETAQQTGQRNLTLLMAGLGLLITVMTYVRRRPTPPPTEPGMKANGLK